MFQGNTLHSADHSQPLILPTLVFLHIGILSASITPVTYSDAFFLDSLSYLLVFTMNHSLSLVRNWKSKLVVHANLALPRKLA